MERRCRLIFGLALTFTVILLAYYGYYRCSGVNSIECSFSVTSSPTPLRQSAYLHSNTSNANGEHEKIVQSIEVEEITFKKEDLNHEYNLNLEENDVLVFVHIQKTGGTTFGRHLVRDLDVEPPCKCFKGRKKCDCYTKGKKIWLFSRFSTGWACGLHADWTELTSCVDYAMEKKLEKIHRKRKYHFITLLRQPVFRFISEWKHVQRGATWKTAQLVCNGRKASLQEVPFCFEGEDWTDVTLDEFLTCPHNLARNRQTRMLADLSLVNCYNHSHLSEEKYKNILLESAKENLKNMAFIGLLEYQNYTQKLFEHTFKIKFTEDFQQYDKTHTGKALTRVTTEQIKQVQKLNDLDIQLYNFAKELFFQRIKIMLTESGSKKDIQTLENTQEDEVEYYDYEEGRDDMNGPIMLEEKKEEGLVANDMEGEGPVANDKMEGEGPVANDNMEGEGPVANDNMKREVPVVNNNEKNQWNDLEEGSEEGLTNHQKTEMKDSYLSIDKDPLNKLLDNV